MKYILHKKPSYMLGISLVEMMISMVLGLILMLALTYVFVGNSRARSEIEKTGRQIENGRYAMQTLVDDISNAGFFAGANTDTALEELDYCDVSVVNERILKPYLVRVNASMNCIPDYKSGTDAIVVRRFSTSSRPTPDGETAPTCPSGKTCVQVNSSTGNATYGTGAMNEKLVSEEFAAVYVPITHIYYVDSQDTLRRASLTWTAGAASFDGETEAIADGIELLSFTVAGNTVKIELLARNTEATSTFTDDKTYTVGGVDFTPGDHFRRQFYSTTVNVYNPIN